jgi:hypothetical protein
MDTTFQSSQSTRMECKSTQQRMDAL